MSEIPQNLLDEAIFGKQVENFLNSDLGKHLVYRAEEEAELANTELKRVLPWRRRKIQELQNRIWRAENFQQWLADIVMDGLQATQQIEEDNG